MCFQIRPNGGVLIFLTVYSDEHHIVLNVHLTHVNKIVLFELPCILTVKNKFKKEGWGELRVDVLKLYFVAKTMVAFDSILSRLILNGSSYEPLQ